MAYDVLADPFPLLGIGRAYPEMLPVYEALVRGCKAPEDIASAGLYLGDIIVACPEIVKTPVRWVGRFDGEDMVDVVWVEAGICEG